MTKSDVLDTFSTATPSAPVTKPKKPITSAKNSFGKLLLMKAFKANPGAMKKARKKAKANKSSDRRSCINFFSSMRRRSLAPRSEGG